MQRKPNENDTIPKMVPICIIIASPFVNGKTISAHVPMVGLKTGPSIDQINKDIYSYSIRISKVSHQALQIAIMLLIKTLFERIYIATLYGI